MPVKPKPLIERFEYRVSPEPNSGCWLWAGGTSRTGYGKFDPVTDAHRVAYELYKELIPDGKCVLHTCDVMTCVNPNHLWLGSLSDNTQDMIAKGRNYTPWSKIGSDHCSSKLTDADVLAIRESKEPTRLLAKRYEVNRVTIKNIRAGRTWKHIR